MKTNLIYLWLSAAVLFVAGACTDIVEVDDVLAKENRPSTGAPVIDRIVLATDDVLPITEAQFEQVVRIEGSNLGDVQSLKFNDVEVDPKEIYSSYEMVLAPVPRALPDVVTNMVYVTTDNGTASAPLSISLPDLTITGLYNEFAQPGDTTTITGDNFDLYGITAEEADIRFGEIPVNILEATRTEVTLQVPANVTKGSLVSIKGGNMDEPVYLTYADPGISTLFDLNNWPGEGAFTHASQYPDAPANFLWDESIINVADGDPAPLEGGKYIRFQGTVGAWGYMVLWAGNIELPAEVAYNPQDYDLRFEVNTLSTYPISSVSRILFGQRDYPWYPAVNGLPLNTYGKWMTVRIPCDSEDSSGAPLLPISDDWDPSMLYSFKIVFSPESEQVFDVSMCNFRFVKR